MQTLGGIRQSAPGWKSITYAPVFHGVRCETTIPTPYGLITGSWNKINNKIKITLKLPAGMSARIKLPGHPAVIIRKSLRKTIPAPASA
jgi:hypothetical protein